MGSLLQAVLTLYNNGLIDDSQYGSFYRDPNIGHTLWTLRQNSSVESLLLSPIGHGKPQTMATKDAVISLFSESLQESERRQFEQMVQTVSTFYDRLKVIVNIEIDILVKFWGNQTWEDLLQCGGLLRIYNRLFPSSQIPSDQLTLDQWQGYFVQVTECLEKLAEPFLAHKLLPSSQNFSAWLPLEIIKQKQGIMALVLSKVEDVVVKLTQLLIFYHSLPCYQGLRTHLSDWHKKVSRVRQSLAQESMVILKQPKNYYMLDVQNEIQIQISNCSGYLSLPENCPTLRIAVLTDQMAKGIHDSGTVQPDIVSQAPVTLEVKDYEFEGGTANINLITKILKRPGNISKNFWHYKHYLLLWTYLSRANASYSGGVTPIPEESPLMVCAVTSPFVCITNVSQNPKASQTLFWSCYVHRLTQFEPPAAATVSQIRSGLTEFTKHETEASWLLPECNLHHLLRHVFQVRDNAATTLVPLSILHSKVGLSRWEVYYRTLVLIKRTLKVPWSLGFILGFDSEEHADQLVRDSDSGCFVLTFSASEPVRLQVTHYRHGDLPAHGTMDELEIQRLSDVVRVSQCLKYVLHWDHVTQRVVKTAKETAFPSTTNKQGWLFGMAE